VQTYRYQEKVAAKKNMVCGAAFLDALARVSLG
jgi:hypothetical protein